jgi:hypothetical protein
MPASTPIYGFPYPLGTDPVGQGAQDIQDLATAVESQFVTSDASLGLVKVTPTNVVGTGASITSSGSVLLSGTGTVRVDGCFTSEFRQYRILYFGNSSNASISNGRLRFSTNGVPNQTNVYGEALNYVQGVPNFGPARAYQIPLTSLQYHAYGANVALDFEWTVSNPQVATVTTLRSMCSSWANNNNIFTMGYGLFNGSAVFDGFELSELGGGTYTGVIRIYGLRT